MAMGKVKRKTDKDDALSRARSFESQELMGQVCLSSLNRSVRTSMPWWCGKGARFRAPLSDFVGFLFFLSNYT
jgi:hypothetical protein